METENRILHMDCTANKALGIQCRDGPFKNPWKIAELDDLDLSTVKSHLTRKQPEPKSADLGKLFEDDADDLAPKSRVAEMGGCAREERVHIEPERYEIAREDEEPRLTGQ
jgi:hypothetical protein